MKPIYDIICELKSTSSRLEKEDILKKNDSPLLRRVFYYTYTYNRVFGIKKIPDIGGIHFNTLHLEDAIEMLSLFEDRIVTGHAAINKLSEILTELSEDDAKVFSRIIQKDMDCGVSSGILNRVFGENFISHYPVMLAQPLNEKNIQGLCFPCIVQMKADGARINAICDGKTVKYFSRNGKEIFASNEILDRNILDMFLYYQEPFVLDGEIICCDSNGKMFERKTSNGIINKAIKGTISEKEISSLNLFVWDIIRFEDFNKGFSNMRYEDRFENHLRYSLEKIHNEKRVHMIETEYANSIQECHEISDRYISSGYEGIIAKNIDMPWEDKRTPNQIKFKKEVECDLLIVGIQEGRGKYSGQIGAYLCESSDGKIRVTVGSGLSDEDRLTKDNNIGKILTVKYNDIIGDEKGYSLFLPRFIEIREDKDIADSFEIIKGK